jgi:hypothetical protein
MPPDPTHQLNRSVCQADFAYSMTLDLIKIVDLSLGNRSVTNDIENVLRKIEIWHQGPVTGFRIMYRDSNGYWDGVRWDGEHATFLRPAGNERSCCRKEASQVSGTSHLSNGTGTATFIGHRPRNHGVRR